MTARGTARPTKRAHGFNVPHKRDHVGISVIVTTETFEKLKEHALKNCRSLTGECRFLIERGLEQKDQ